MSPRKQQTSPQDAQRIADHARQHVPCGECGAEAGEPCTGPGPGRSIHKGRYIASAIILKRQDRDAKRTPEQQAELEAVLAGLPKVPEEEIEKCKTPGGGYSFTRERLASWSVPWPPPAGWLRAIRGDDAGDDN